MMSVKSGIQKEVLALYRTLLRESVKKDRSGSEHAKSTVTNLLASDDSITSHARSEFRKQALQVDRKDFRTIEYRVRHGYKQIKLLQMPGVKTFKSATA
ncbi:complex 1 LYR family protein [Nitzschia inconspicua]|uniref:Complex 1 LYR family protein n=1 Tax=Nitzschia inconspicua TaxID=303405 RepID=A0A9K3PRK4_9STRA|nr:complex 1 LYR family protein [Nitzschia inconspicua]